MIKIRGLIEITKKFCSSSHGTIKRSRNSDSKQPFCRRGAVPRIGKFERAGNIRLWLQGRIEKKKKKKEKKEIKRRSLACFSMHVAPLAPLSPPFHPSRFATLFA